MSWRTGFKEPARPTRIAKKKRFTFPRIRVKISRRMLIILLLALCIAAGFGLGIVAGHTLIPRTVTSVMFVPRYHVITKTLTRTLIATKTVTLTKTIIRDVDHPRIYSVYAQYQALNGLPVIKLTYIASAPFLIRIVYPNNQSTPLIVASPQSTAIAIPISTLCTQPPPGTYRVELLDHQLRPILKALEVNISTPSLKVYLSQYFVSSTNPHTVTDLTLSIVNTGGVAFINRIVIEFLAQGVPVKTLDISLGCLTVPSMHSEKLDLRVAVSLPTSGKYVVYAKLLSANKVLYSGSIGTISIT